MNGADRSVRVAVTGTDHALADEFASALVGHGMDVARIARADFADIEDARAAIAGAVARLGGLDGVVHVSRSVTHPVTGALATMSADDWTRATDADVLATLWCLQAAYGALAEHGGAVVVVLPTHMFTGAPEQAAVVAAAEGQRALAKSAARQWGAAGIAVNVLAVETVAGATLLGSMHSAGVTGGPGAALAFLLRQPPVACTGQTLVVDGGSWMPV